MANNKVEKKARAKLLDMLKYKRPEGGITQQIFNQRFVQPMMGRPDEFGNYIHIIPYDNEPNRIVRIAFMAHHDTVHSSDGVQTLEVFMKDGSEFVGTKNSNCLGADCTTGVWLILEMIKAKVPGIYVVHAGEEVGGIGSSALVKSNPDWLSELDFAISFDRKGTTSVITEQSGGTCCSDEFVSSLESILNLNLKPDPTGTYTDSAEYIYDVAECTNLSVGYYYQHTKNEVQDITFALLLRDRLINAEWDKLEYFRKPGEVGDYSFNFGKFDDIQDLDSYYSKDDNKGVYDNKDKGRNVYGFNSSDMRDIVKAYPSAIAEFLNDLGYTTEDVMSYTKEFYSNDRDFPF